MLDDVDEHHVAGIEIGVIENVGVEAKAVGTVGNGAEDPARVLAADDGAAPAAQRVPDISAYEWVGAQIPDGNCNSSGPEVQFLVGGVFIPQIEYGGIVEVATPQLHVEHAALGPHATRPDD